MDKSSNPVFSESAVKKAVGSMERTEPMTIKGTLSKAFAMLAVVGITGAISWQITANNPELAIGLTVGSMIVALVVAMIIIFTKPNPMLIAIYAVAEGIVLGAISFIFNESFGGIVTQALLLTGSITGGMFLLYATRVIKVTEKLKSVIIIATFGTFIFLMLSWIISLFSPGFAEFAYEGTSGILIALAIVVIAALNLLLDFSFIEEGANKKLPKQFEWYGAFGLVVTLIWLYVSILRLLGASRN